MSEDDLLIKRLKDQAFGAKKGYIAGRKEMREYMQRKQAEAKQRVAETIKYIETFLTGEERAKFTKAATKATNLKRQVGLLERIDRAANKQEIDKLASEIDNLSRPATGADLEYQDKLNDIINEINLEQFTEREQFRLNRLEQHVKQHGTKGIPQALVDQLENIKKRKISEFSSEARKDLVNALIMTRKLGYLKRKLKAKYNQRERNRAIQELVSQTTNFDIKETGNPQIDVKRNAIAEFYQNTLHAIRSFDAMDGYKNYKGENVKLHKRLVNSIHEAETKRRNDSLEYMERMAQIKKEWTETEQRDIAILLYNDMGLEAQVEALMEKHKMDELPKVTEEYRKAIDITREIIGRNYPDITALYEEINNKHMGKVENYFPIKYEGEYQTTPEEAIIPTRHRKTNMEAGFTKERVPGVKKTARTDLFRIVEESLGDQAYYLNVQPQIEDIKYIVKSKEFLASAGARNSKFWADHLDIIARRGWSSEATNSALDQWLRQARMNISRAVLGYKISSIMVQPMAIIDALAYAQATYGTKASRRILEGFAKSWINPKFAKAYIVGSPALMERKGGEMAIEEALANDKTFYDKFINGSMKLLQQADIRTAAGVQSAFEKILTEEGVKNPKQEAEFLMELVSGTNNIAQRPHILSKGEVQRTIFVFQNFIMNRWGLSIHDLINKGLLRSPQAKQKLMAVIGLAIISAGAMGENEARWALQQLFSPEPDKMKKKPAFLSALMAIPSTVPVVGNIADAVTTGFSSDVPLMKALDDMFVGGASIIKGKEPETKVKGALKSTRALLSLGLGIPGTYQAHDIAKLAILGKKENTHGFSPEAWANIPKERKKVIIERMEEAEKIRKQRIKNALK